jgi:tRNA A-37 threonylcarbamoyl transferase component Bud32
MSALGRLVTRGDRELLALLRDELEEAAARGEVRQGRRELGGLRAYFKCSPLRGKARVRHALRHALLAGGLPRLREFENLAWLREHGFHAPRPLLAGVGFRLLLPSFQFLLTEAVEPARTLRELFEGEQRELRVPALEELGRELARMHAAGFVHRDAFPRNILFDGSVAKPRIHFLDAWRGGPRPGLRGPSYDLACLMLHGAALFEPREAKCLFESYFDTRREHGAGVDPRRLLRSAARGRKALVRRFLRTRRPGSPLPVPPGHWSPEQVLDEDLRDGTPPLH